MSSAAFVRGLLVGIGDAFADLHDQLAGGAPLALLERLGWTVPDATDLTQVRDGFQALSEALDDLGNVSQTLAQLPDDASLDDFAPALSAMTEAIAEAIVAVQDLDAIDLSAFPAPFSSADLWAALAAEGADTLIVGYLGRHSDCSTACCASWASSPRSSGQPPPCAMRTSRANCAGIAWPTCSPGRAT